MEAFLNIPVLNGHCKLRHHYLYVGTTGLYPRYVTSMTGLLKLLILCSYKIDKRNMHVFADSNSKLETGLKRGQEETENY